MINRANQNLVSGSFILFLVAAIPRVLGAFFLPNAFGDAYVYIRDIGTLSTKISAGTFRLTDLFGFWLPLYQFISAVLNIFVRNGFYSGKIVSALFGVGVCVLVYAVTWRITGNRRAALVVFLLVALNPLHIFYSASAMTDVPHAFVVLGALYFLLTGNWIIAAAFAALAGLTRVESWMLIAIIPVIQFIRERRISVVTLLILILPPLFWFYLSWKATGDWLACFKQRQQYHDWLLVMNPTLAKFGAPNVVRDLATLLVSTDFAVLIACCVAAWLVIGQILRRGEFFASLRLRARPSHSPAVHSRENRALDANDIGAISPPLIFFFAFLALLLGAYLMHQQPIIFPRYGLILFTLGLPVLAWTFLRLKTRNAALGRRLFVGAAIILVVNAAAQFVYSIGVLNQYSVQRAVADYLRDHFDKNSNARIFCDEGTVRVLSGIPAEKFLTSADAPDDIESFIKFLEEKDVECLVFVGKADSKSAKLLSSLKDYDGRIAFELICQSHSRFLPTDILVYRIRIVPR